MSGRIVACATLVCALWNLLGAREARAFPGYRHRSVSQYTNHNQSPGIRLAERRMPAWPPRRPSRQRPVARPKGAIHGGRFGDAFMVDTSVVLGPASGYNYSYGVASNGDGWRVMWADENDYTVRTSGVSTDGSLLDAQGSLVGHEEYSTSGLTSSVAGMGSGFIAVWTAGTPQGIWAARLDSAGALIDSFLVFESDSGPVLPAIAFDGDSTCLVVWMLYGSSDYDIYAARVTTGGRVLDPVPFPVAQEPSQLEAWPSVAFGRGIYLAAWTAIDTSWSDATTKAIRVTTDGIVLDTAIFLRHDPAVMQMYAAVAFGDTCFLASWAEGMEEPDVYAARVSVSGNLMDTACIQLCSGPTYDMNSSVGFDGTTYLVMWCETDTMAYYSALRGRRVTVDGVPLDSNLIRPQLPCGCQYPKVAADHANFLVAFDAADTFSYDDGVGCLRISPDGAVLDSGIFFPLGADAQAGPSGASDGTDFLAAWLETRSQGQALCAARISADGTVLDPAGFPVNDAPGNKQSLATGFGDSLYLVAWADYRSIDGNTDIFCARVGSDGEVLDANGIVVCAAVNYQDLPDISFDGQNFLVVWQDYRSAMYGNIYAARVSPAGVVLDPNGFPVAAADTFDDAQPAVCFTGTDYLAVWPGMNTSVSESRVFGALVSPAGTITRPRFAVSRAGYPQAPTVARGPANSLVAWENYDTICAARVQTDGTVLDTNGILVDSSDYFMFADPLPHVATNAAGYKVLWRRYDYFGDTTHFAVAQIDTAGNVVRKGDWFGLPGSDNGFDAVYGSGPELLLLFSCWTDSALGRYYANDRLWGRFGQVPGIEQTDNRQLRSVTGGASIVRGVLFLPEASSRKPQATSLLDISGREVMKLKPGANDASRLSPGVYFVREMRAQAVTKVVVTR